MAEKNHIIIGLDLGTKLGFAVLSKGGSLVRSGTEDFGKNRGDTIAGRYVRYRGFLHLLVSTYRPSLVGYEEVKAHAATYAAQMYGAYQGILMTVCEEFNVPLVGYGVGAIKKFATGKGNAKKPAMIEAAKQAFPVLTVVDDNHADALHIARMTCNEAC